MVIEYAGEMVRQTVADRREAASYNQLVGAGTYVFSLDDDFLVDATKAGNMAHLLNHSCNPNCYSKHVHVWSDSLGQKVPHVVICAKQAIQVGEELTYDYRYQHAVSFSNVSCIWQQMLAYHIALGVCLFQAEIDASLQV